MTFASILNGAHFPCCCQFFNMTAARLIIALLLSFGACVPVSDYRKRQDAAFDYVIVGGGTAGLTLAARLSEDSSTSVAVIEAGTYYSISDPLLASTPAGDTVRLQQLASAFQTAPQVAAIRPILSLLSVIVSFLN